MGKDKKKNKAMNPTKRIIIAVLLVILFALLAIFVIPQGLYSLRGGDSAAADDFAQEEQANAESRKVYSADDELTFPLTLEDGKLEVESLFSFSGVNPDGGMEDIEDVVSITLKNASEQYLESTIIHVILSDGTECSFVVTDLPAGTSTMAFATENEPLPQGVFCVDLSVEATYAENPVWDQVAVSTVGTTVTLQNLSNKDLSNLDVYCHDSFGESYFGGITYKHTINELAVGQTATIDVSESLLGMIDVVRITIND